VLDYSHDPRIRESHMIESLARGRWVC
jgi:hypothetical protein